MLQEAVKIVAVGIVAVFMAAVWTSNGWSWKTDVPALIAQLGTWLFVVKAQKKLKRGTNV